MSKITKLFLHGKEYKVSGSGISATAFPDYSASSASQTLTSPYTTTTDGYINWVGSTDQGPVTLYVNGVQVASVAALASGDQTTATYLAPVVEGDVVTWNGGTAYFCPIKYKLHGPEAIIAFGEPDWSARQTIAANTNFSSPKTGYIYYSPTGDTSYPSGISQGDVGNITVNGYPIMTATQVTGSDSSHPDTAFFVVQKGDIISQSFTAGTVYYMPATVSDAALDGVTVEWDSTTSTLNFKKTY